MKHTSLQDIINLNVTESTVDVHIEMKLSRPTYPVIPQDAPLTPSKRHIPLNATAWQRIVLDPCVNGELLQLIDVRSRGTYNIIDAIKTKRLPNHAWSECCTVY
jgi:hypothetical protein